MANQTMHDKFRENSTTVEVGEILFCVEQKNYDAFFKTLETVMKQSDPLTDWIFFAPTRCDGNDVAVRITLSRVQFECIIDCLEIDGMYLRAFGWNQFDVIKG